MAMSGQIPSAAALFGSFDHSSCDGGSQGKLRLAGGRSAMMLYAVSETARFLTEKPATVPGSF